MKVPLLPLIGVLLCSCSGYQYVASPQFVPLNTKRGELQGNIYPSSIQIGYSVTNHISLFATKYKRLTGEYPNPLRQRGNFSASGHATELNAGIGFFKKRGDFVYEILLGAGAGEMTYSSTLTGYSDYHFDMAANKRNIYLQPDFGVKLGRHFEVGFFSKFTFCQYRDITTALSLGDKKEPRKQDQYFLGKQNADVFFIGTGVAVKAGWKNVKFNIQSSPNINLMGYNLRYQRLNINMGLSFNVDLIKKTKE